ncbi:MAG: hypothetical protein HC824_04180 [Synechococcales cyanobacterium RM1_1_8]|nr:hypothetical protein [Synechococcales cyanobacterium RM1_1_8]
MASLTLAEAGRVNFLQAAPELAGARVSALILQTQLPDSLQRGQITLDRGAKIMNRVGPAAIAWPWLPVSGTLASARLLKPP